jgi:hypothetical protein
MQLKEFSEKVANYTKDIGIHGPEGFIGSHKLQGSLGAYDPESNKYYVITGIEIDQLMGCGCWRGIQLILEEDKL